MNAFTRGLKQLLSQPEKTDLSLSTWGEKSCGLAPEQIEEVMQWLAKSLLKAGYRGTAQVIWHEQQDALSYEPALKRFRRSLQPTFLYRCGESRLAPPEGYYWRIMPEHPSGRIYQLEAKQD